MERTEWFVDVCERNGVVTELGPFGEKEAREVFETADDLIKNGEVGAVTLYIKLEIKA